MDFDRASPKIEILKFLMAEIINFFGQSASFRGYARLALQVQSFFDKLFWVALKRT